MRSVSDLKLSRALSVDELMGSPEPSVLWYRDRYPCDRNFPLLPQSDQTEEITREHLEEPDAPPLGIAAIRNVLISGLSVVGTKDSIFRMHEIVPYYVNYYITNGREDLDFSLDGKKIIDIDGLCVLVTHFHSVVYGHWLLEGLPKLLILKELIRDLPPLKFILPNSSKVQPFVIYWIKTLIPDAAIVCYDETSQAIACEQLLMPTLATSPKYFFNSYINSLLHHAGAFQSDASRRIYVSRRGQSHFRRLENRQEIERIAEQCGLEIVIPEDLIIPMQVKTFREANLIVGEFGTSMHNSMFSPTGARVLCLNWINELQSRVSCLRQQPTGYILPSNGAPVKYKHDSTEATPYHIDPWRFERALRELI